jgi:hypothetical protein
MLSALPLASHAQSQAEDAPPNYNATCNCYRNVPYGTVSWLEPTTKRWARQVMDIWMPQGFGDPLPIVYYGHPNGTLHTIAKDSSPDSLWSRLVKPLTDRGYIVVSYEFRHPVVNYVPGKPAPRYDIQKAINAFAAQYAPALGADPSNSFITGQSRGGGLGLLTGLSGNFTSGTKVQAMWTYQAQTTFNCNEMAQDFVLESDRTAFLSSCTTVPGAGSALQAVTPSAPPTVAAYERPFRMELVPAAEVDVHYPDFGWQLCNRFTAEGSSNVCQGAQSVPLASAWIGIADYFDAHRQPPV